MKCPECGEKLGQLHKGIFPSMFYVCMKCKRFWQIVDGGRIT